MTNGNLPILTAISNLLKLKPRVTYTEVAMAAEVKRSKCLDVIVSNKTLLVLDKKGNITGFIKEYDYFNSKTKSAFNEGNVFYRNEINYGCDGQLIVGLGHENKVKDLITTYYCGGIGDCYGIDIVLDNQKNREELVKRGFIFWNDYIAKLKEQGDGVLVTWNERHLTYQAEGLAQVGAGRKYAQNR